MFSLDRLLGSMEEMSYCFRPCTLDQPLLLAPSLQDWLPEGHLARFVADVVEQLDLSPIYAAYARQDGRGQLGYHPLLLTRLLLYGHCIGVVSSRQIERRTDETEVEDRARTGRVADAKGDCGTGVRADQRAAAIPTLQLSRNGKGARRVEADLPDAQPAEVVPRGLASAERLKRTV
jgi:hypothetical protein